MPQPVGSDTGFPMPQNNNKFQPEPTMQDDEPESYENDFDPGVEANEEEDPKKYIQQLTGKLAQSLRKYNKSLPQPDADLGKYVAGMVVKQAIEGLSQEDIEDIMDKLDKDEEPDKTDNDDNTDNAQIDAQDTMNHGNLPGDSDGGFQPMQENISERSARIDNLYNNFIKDSDEQDIPTKGKRQGYNRKAYVAPSWK